MRNLQRFSSLTRNLLTPLNKNKENDFVLPVTLSMAINYLP